MQPRIPGHRQMTAKEFYQTQGIASARIVVEMKMEQFKNYRILSGTLPLSEAHLAEQMVFLCLAWTNLLPPLMKWIIHWVPRYNVPVYNDCCCYNIFWLEDIPVFSLLISMMNVITWVKFHYFNYQFLRNSCNHSALFIEIFIIKYLARVYFWLVLIERKIHSFYIFIISIASF